jgi:hypothetical protein
MDNRTLHTIALVLAIIWLVLEILIDLGLDVSLFN